jgi:hypothetical protein
MTGCLKSTSAWYILIIPYKEDKIVIVCVSRISLTFVTLSQVGVALISFKIGELSWNGTPFFTCLINSMQPKKLLRHIKRKEVNKQEIGSSLT